MKKLILLSAFVLLLSFTVNAQFETGQKIITGGFSIANNDLESSNTTSNPSNSNFNFSLNASVGKFINLHHAAGFTIGYSNSTQNSSANYNSLKQNNFALNYFSTYYKPFTKNFYGWLSWNAGVNYTHADYSSYLETSNGFGI